ncbi:chromate efflux transporter [Paenibacillus zeisoli]|uniref:Chromate efflux transporter n=1 Tax=Paenibacillus zeisoli TaxID=2496267 RepID=A0A433X185_9BACL|nr:chromate efflux transporter [Paenibacillus zeisoli]RUT27660.1 chromate efflux transporter [Paenibacillus zeisoli]
MQKEKTALPGSSKSGPSKLLEILAVSTKLGLTSFGGPTAHLGYFHNEYIRRRKWMDERSYADLVALCQFLPGPASSQVGIGIGMMRAGVLGGLIAWLGFTIPSVAALILFAVIMQGMDISHAGWIHGLKIAAIAIVAHAVLGMGQKLAPDKIRATIAVLAAAVILLWQTVFSQVAVIAAAGLLGLWLYRKVDVPEIPDTDVPVKRSFAILCLTLLIGLLLILPLLRLFIHQPLLALFDSFYRSGSLVFGGGHVVLPLLERETVGAGWISKSDFLAGYGAAQAVPGPLFTFASYLGQMSEGYPGAITATLAIFLPAFLLIAGTLPFWSLIRRNSKVQGALIAINAAVVGILLAALYNPLWTTTIMNSADFVLVSILFILLVYWKLPPWAVVAAGAAGGMIISML